MATPRSSARKTSNAARAFPAAECERIIQGLFSGQYRQFGGLIQMASDASQVIAFVRRTPAAESPPSKQPAAASSVPGEVPWSAGALQILTSIEPASAIINVGVSAVGFAALFHKLGQVQKGMLHLQGTIAAGQAETSRKLDDVTAKLCGLTVMTARLTDDVHATQHSVQRLTSQLDVAQFAPLAAAIESLDELSQRRQDASHDRIERQIERAQQVRAYCVGMLQHSNLDSLPIYSADFVAVLNYLHVAALAVAVEARGLRLLNETVAAAHRIKSTMAIFGPISSTLVLRLLDGDAALLVARDVRAMLPVRHLQAIAAWLAASNQSMPQTWQAMEQHWSEEVAKFSSLAKQRLKSLRSASSAWTVRIDLAHQLVRNMENLASLATEYRLCSEVEVPIDDWENCDLSETYGPLALLRPPEAEGCSSHELL